MGNIVAIVGRPNVGKSTLFNRLTETRSAIVDDTAGTTRDRQYGKAEWCGVEFSVIDTGGYIEGSDDVFEDEIRKQVKLAIDEADLVLFLVDVNTGITGMDQSVADILRRSRKKVMLITNKVDTPDRTYLSNEFYGLGLGDPWAISSANGGGTGDLLDEVIKHLDTEPVSDEVENIPKFAIVGRPNVGKSSLLNALTGEDRQIVTPVSGTTRDAVYIRYNKFNHDFYLIDTAGLRKKNKVQEDLEFYSVLRSIRSIESSDVCILMLDASVGIESQDLSIFNTIKENKKGLVICVNKWDLVEKTNKSTNEYTDIIKKRIAPFTDVPILFISAHEKQRLIKVLDTAMEVYQNRTQKITTSKLNEALLEVIENYPPPATKGKYVKIKYITQLPTPSPSFAFFCNLPQYVKEPYKRFLENQIRSRYNFTGVPIQIYMRQK
jgi:GTP-binding protein